MLQLNQFGEGSGRQGATTQFGEPVDTAGLSDPGDFSEYVNQLPPSRDSAGRVQTDAPALPFRGDQLGQQAPARPVRPASRRPDTGAAAALGQGHEAMIAALHGHGSGQDYLDDDENSVEEEDGDEDEARDQLGELGATGGESTSSPTTLSPADSSTKPPSVGQAPTVADKVATGGVAGEAGAIKHIYLEVKHMDETLLNRYLYLQECHSAPVQSALASGIAYSCRQSGKEYGFLIT